MRNQALLDTMGKEESGQALVMALLALALGVLLIAGFLYYVSTSQRAVTATRQQTEEHYAADAGIEHAIWQLQNTSLTQTLRASPFLTTTSLSLNGEQVVVTITRVLTH